MSCYPEPYSHIRDKVKVGLDWSNYTSKKVMLLKSETIKKMLVWITEVYCLDVGRLKTVPIHLKKSSDAVNKEVIKNTKFNAVNTKVNNLEKKVSVAINLNQYNTDKQSLEKK